MNYLKSTKPNNKNNNKLNQCLTLKTPNNLHPPPNSNATNTVPSHTGNNVTPNEKESVLIGWNSMRMSRRLCGECLGKIRTKRY